MSMMSLITKATPERFSVALSATVRLVELATAVILDWKTYGLLPSTPVGMSLA
jgi:hypothetical protein